MPIMLQSALPASVQRKVARLGMEVNMSIFVGQLRIMQGLTCVYSASA